MTKTSRKDHPGASTRTQVRFAGFGGQGIVLAGKIMGKAAAIFEGANAVMTQNYGPEARGGACSADVVISAARIHYPRVDTPDVLVLMAEEAARTYGPRTAPDALILVNENLVKTLPAGAGLKIYGIPATDMATKLGNVIMSNIVMLGFVAATTRLVGEEAMKQAILQSIPPGTDKKNLAAFQAGYDHGVAALARATPGGGQS